MHCQFFVLILFRDVLTIAAVDAVTCILAGFAIFATLGFLAHNQGKEVEDVISQGKCYRTQGYLLYISFHFLYKISTHYFSNFSDCKH